MRKEGLFYLATAFVAFFLYVPSLGHGFVWDDRSLILENRYLRDWSEAGRNLTGDFFRRSGEPDRIGHWRPAVTLSLMTDATVHGTKPTGYHLTNVLLHAAASCLLLAVARRLPISRTAAFGAALLFAAHPVHVESVAWISGRTDLLCAVFALAAVLLDLESGRRPGVLPRYAAVGCTAFALLAKEMAVVIPAAVAARVLLLGSPAARPRDRARGALAAALPHLAAVAVYLVVRLAVLGIVPRAPAAAGSGRLALFWTWWSAFLDYARVLVWPAALGITPRVGLATLPLSPRVAAGLVLFGALAAAAWLARRRAPALSFAVVVFLAGLLPLTNFVVPVRAAAGIAFPWAERFLYLPSAWFCLAAAWLLIDAPAAARGRSGTPRWAVLLLAALAAAGAARAVARERDWKDELRLFGTDARDNPGSASARFGYGLALADAGRSAEAEAEYRAALALAPDAVKARYNLANLLIARGDAVAAAAEYRRVLERDPGHTKARLNLGIALMRSGLPDEALETFRAAAAASPDSAEAKLNAANALRALGRPADAIPLYEAALSLDAALLEARLGLAAALFESGDAGRGESALGDLLRDAPGFAPAHLLRAIHLDGEGRTAEAEAEFREVLRLDPGNEKVRRRLSR